MCVMCVCMCTYACVYMHVCAYASVCVVHMICMYMSLRVCLCMCTYGVLCGLHVCILDKSTEDNPREH